MEAIGGRPLLAAVVGIAMVILSLIPVFAISFDENVCFERNSYQICFMDVDVVWDEKHLLKYEFEEGKIVELAVAPLASKDKVYVYLIDERYYWFDKPSFVLGYTDDMVEPGTYDVEVKVIDQDGNVRLDFRLERDADYNLFIEGTEKEETKLTVKDVETELGKEVKIEATLATNFGGIRGATIDFYINGSYVGSAETNSYGKAKLRYTPEDPGVYEIKAVFEGDSVYKGSEGYAYLRVAAEEIPEESPAPTVTTAEEQKMPITPPVNLTSTPAEVEPTQPSEKMPEKPSAEVPGFGVAISVGSLSAALAIRKIKNTGK